MLDTNRPRRVPGFEIAEREAMSGELVLFHPGTQVILYSNRTGTLIWGLCDGERTVAEIIQLLKEAYPDAAEIEADIRETLATFSQHNAIEWV